MPIQRHKSGTRPSVTEHELGPLEAITGENAKRVSFDKPERLEPIGKLARSTFERPKGQFTLGRANHNVIEPNRTPRIEKLVSCRHRPFLR